MDAVAKRTDFHSEASCRQALVPAEAISMPLEFDVSLESKYQTIRAWLLLRLSEMRHDVQSGLREIEGDKHHLADLGELAADVNIDNAVFEQFRSSSESIQQIEAALERLTQGTYEQCEDCGDSIGTERLEALPFATQCIDCKRRAEHNQQLNSSG